MNEVELKLWHRALRGRHQDVPEDAPKKRRRRRVRTPGVPLKRIRNRMTREQEQARRKELKAERIRLGFCYRCGGPRNPEALNKIYCDPCRARNTERWATIRHERHRAGCCIRCGRPRGEDGTASQCRSCADAHNKASNKRRRALIRKGLCRSCGKRPLHKGGRCKECWGR